MALTFEKITEVNFGGVKLQPKLTQELRLRLKNLNPKTASDSEMIELLSSCFGDKAAEAREFMESNMTEVGLARLFVYLSQGPEAVERFDRLTDQATLKKMEKHLESVANV